MADKLLKIITALYLIIFLILIALAKLLGVSAYIFDSIFFMILTIVLYFSYDKLRMNIPIFTLVVFGLILHNLGVFGFYGQSPLFVPWDNVTHFFPFIFTAMMFFNFLYQWMDRKFFSARTIFLVIVALLATLGIGSIVENIEYLGFSMLGFGEGGFYFGTGDTFTDQNATTIEEIEAYGGGWFNTMNDLVCNLLGALLGIIIMSFCHFRNNREKVEL
jgi:uncharacterized membrane protein YjdF